MWGRNIARKGGIACYKQYFSFSHNGSYSYISLPHQIAALCGNGLNLCIQGWKIQLKKKKMHVSSIFSFTRLFSVAFKRSSFFCHIDFEKWSPVEQKILCMLQCIQLSFNSLPHWTPAFSPFLTIFQ